MTGDLSNRKEWFGGVRRLVIKIGSAVLTGPRGLDRVMIHRLSDQIAELKAQGREVVVVSSGAVASGVRKVGLAEKPKAIPQKQAAAAVGQSVLMQAWEEAFDKYDLLVAQVLLTAEDLSHRHRYLNARNTLEVLIDWGISPIINENDTVVVEEIKFGDNDQLSIMIAGLIGADLIVTLTDTEGLYDCDPRLHSEAKLIPLVQRVDAKLLACAAPPQELWAPEECTANCSRRRNRLHRGFPWSSRRGGSGTRCFAFLPGSRLERFSSRGKGCIMAGRSGLPTCPNRRATWC